VSGRLEEAPLAVVHVPAAADQDSLVQALLDASPDGLLYADADGRILLVNRRLETLFGYEHDTLIGQRVESLVPDAVRGVHASHRAAYHANPEVRPMGVGRHLLGRRADGTEIPVEISLSPLVTAHGEGVVAAIRDDAERRAARVAYTAAALTREDDRIAQGLLDTVVAGIFRAGLTLHSALEISDGGAAGKINEAIAQIDEVIRSMRTVIFAVQQPPGA